MTHEELDKKIELTLAQNRAALKRVDALEREYDRLDAIHTATTKRLLEDLREAARRR
ncbi:MAG: hypothetical protein ACTHN3_13815 [Solirubrobacterales bacterium]